MVKYVCSICGYVYDEEAEGNKWEELLTTWQCPRCGVAKDMFEKEGDAKTEEEHFLE